jgi:hypothetical protein
MMHTTLNAILARGPCGQRPNEDGSLSGWLKLLAGLGKTEPDDESLPFSEILRINGLEDALWAARSAPQYAREWRLYMVWCARQVQHLMTDKRSIDALDVAEKYALGQATDADLAAARAAAQAAAWDAAQDEWDAALAATQASARASAWAAVWDAAWASAWNAALAAARAAAWDAAWDAARDAARAAALESALESARDAARDAAWDAAWNAAQAAQAARFLEMVTRKDGE